MTNVEYNTMPKNEEQRAEARKEIVALTDEQIRDFAVHIAHRYQTECEKDMSLTRIGSAIAVMAAFFRDVDPAVAVKEDGTEFNTLLFQQRGMLGNLCQNAKWMLENADRRHEELMTKLDEQEATFDDTEIAIRNLDRTIQDVERLQFVQLPACRQWFELTKAAYEEVMGEEWKPFVKQTTRREQTASAVRARLDAIRGK